MNRTVPTVAMLLGIAGLIPFIACGLGALSLREDYAHYSVMALTSYGAVILAFLGGVHWGFGLDAAGAPPVTVQRGRFLLGVVPSLIGWVALLVTFIGLPYGGLLVLAAGFIATTVIEARASREGWMPRSYMGLRWVLSVVVVSLLVAVWLILALGGRINL